MSTKTTPCRSRYTTGSKRWWTRLVVGRRFAVGSFRGSRYTVTYLGTTAGTRCPGIYVRRSDDSLARMAPGRLDPKSYQALAERSCPIRLGDELILVPEGGRQVRGKVLSVGEGDLTLQVFGAVVSVPFSKLRRAEMHLVFRAANLVSGDEILVSSRSGRTYRGVVRSTTQRSVRITTTTGQELSLRVDRLDLRSLVVLIKLDMNSEDCE